MINLKKDVGNNAHINKKVSIFINFTTDSVEVSNVFKLQENSIDEYEYVDIVTAIENLCEMYDTNYKQTHQRRQL